VSVNERKFGIIGGGHAFLMHYDGFSILKELARGENGTLPGKPVDTFVYKKPDGQLIKELELDQWQCFKRTDLTSFLMGMLPGNKLNDDRIFSHFVYEDGHITTAAFLNGELEYGDVFIGADGANSIVRREIFGEVEFVPGRVKEVVGIVQHPELAQYYLGKFTKFQESGRGLAFGLIPTSTTELVWFMQYDPALGDLTDRSPEKLQEFCLTMLKDFPAEVLTVMKVNSFNTSYIWNTRDFDLLSEFHYNNVVLIGDAAHLALPFTSAGTTNAMLDAKVLMQSILDGPDYIAAFASYYMQRSAQVAKHVQLGRELRDSFLSSDTGLFTLPLIINQIQR
jgi:2-polyprenyl-6-methoxyphenol hydroxylase-like FAD-dependent oxidoreductase